MTDDELANALYTRILAQVALLALVASGATSREAVKTLMDEALLTLEEQDHGAARPAAVAECRARLDRFLGVLEALPAADDRAGVRGG